MSHPIQEQISVTEKLQEEKRKLKEKIDKNKEGIERLFEEGKGGNLKNRNPELFQKLLDRQKSIIEQHKEFATMSDYRFAGIVKLKPKKPINVFEESEKTKMERKAPKRIRYTRKDKFNPDVEKIKDLGKNTEATLELEAIKSRMDFEDQKSKLEEQKAKYLKPKEGTDIMIDANSRLLSQVQAKLELINLLS